MKRNLSLLFAGALMGASAVSLFHGTSGFSANAAGSETYRQLAIFGDIFERVRAQYRKAKAQADANRAALHVAVQGVEQSVANAWAQLAVAQASLQAREQDCEKLASALADLEKLYLGARPPDSRGRRAGG